MTNKIEATQALDSYAFEVVVDDNGQPIMSGAEWKGGSPTEAAVVTILSTPKGTCAHAPAFGLDWSRIGTLAPGAEPAVVAAVTDALDVLTGDRTIERVNITAQIVRRGVVAIDVSFYDPRARSRREVSWRS